MNCSTEKQGPVRYAIIKTILEQPQARAQGAFAQSAGKAMGRGMRPRTRGGPR